MRGSVGKKIIEGLKDFAEVLESDATVSEKLTCRTVMLDLVPVPYSPETVKATRKLLMVSQAVFAQFLGTSVRTVRAWEQGENEPSPMACRFMEEIQRNPDHWQKRLRESIKVKTTTPC